MASERDTYFEQQAIAYDNVCKLVGLDPRTQPDQTDVLKALTKKLQEVATKEFNRGYDAGYDEGYGHGSQE